MKSWVIAIIVLAVLGVIAGGYWYMNSYKAPTTPASTASAPTSQGEVKINVVNNTPTSNPPSTPTPNQPSAKTYNVDIQNFAFSLLELTIKNGDTIIWTNKDSVGHTVTSDSGSELSSSMINNGQTYSHTFSTAGTFAYHCTPHPNMKATIIVE